MSQKDPPKPRGTTLIRVPLACHVNLSKMARRRRITVCALVDLLVGEEIERAKIEKRRVREYEEVGL